jgi:hypothetical protein
MKKPGSTGEKPLRAFLISISDKKASKFEAESLFRELLSLTSALGVVCP